MTPDLIESTLGEKAVAHPIRAFVGVNSDPLYPSGRSEMMLDELERLGAFDRKYLLLVSPTGTGWVDQTMIESVEILTRGDIATACIQYGRGPSFLEVQKVHLGRSQFRGLLWGVRERLRGLPEDKRPKVLVFGESLGAWSSSDVVMHQGIAGFDHYGIDHALWFGLPGLAKWSKTGMRQGSSDLVPAGTVEAFDNFDEYEDLSVEDRRKLRAVIVDHDNDPIAQMSFRWAVKRPPWLDGEARGRNVPEGMQWVSLITFVHVMVDAMNAMRTVPGQFKSFGHDYRGDTAHFVHAAYHLDDVTDDQMDKVVATLKQLELERGERIKTAKAEATEDGEAPKRTSRPRRPKPGIYLRDRTPMDADKPAVEITPGDVPGELQ
ncbi:MAG: alpha/beta-hydrolase family protein [Acidimicrobiia bacterium]